MVVDNIRVYSVLLGGAKIDNSYGLSKLIPDFVVRKALRLELT